MPEPRRVRCAPKAIIICDGRLLVLQMRDRQGLWYMLPGGGQRAGETLEEALKRECREEAGIEIALGPLRFVRDYIAAHHEFADEDNVGHQIELMFVCRIVDDSRLGRGTALDADQVGVAWLPVDELEGCRLYPKAIRPLLGGTAEVSAPVYLGDVN